MPSLYPSVLGRGENLRVRRRLRIGRNREQETEIGMKNGGCILCLYFCSLFHIHPAQIRSEPGYSGGKCFGL